MHAGQQVPAAGASVLDHVAWFAPDLAAAEEALHRLGFTLTPFTVQQNRVHGRLKPAGTGNRLVLLADGYIEVLTRTGEDTPIARQFAEATARYEGLHLIAIGERDAAAAHARLAAAGFGPLPVVDLSREVATEAGSGVARFEVVRVPPGTMPEGRIQICRHHTPALVWQPRWLRHANGAEALLDVLVAVADGAEAADRFGRFTGVAARPAGEGRRVVELARGAVTVVDADRLPYLLDGLVAPAVPSIAAVAVRTGDLAAAQRWWDDHGVEASRPAPGVALVRPEQAVGAALALCGPGARPPWR